MKNILFIVLNELLHPMNYPLKYVEFFLMQMGLDFLGVDKFRYQLL